VTCDTCGSADTRPLWLEPGGANQWHRCNACGCDTSEARYAREAYGAEYAAALLVGDCGSIDAGTWNHEHNAAFFDRHAPGKPGRTFLDVGCGAGVSLEVMRRRGWACVGWDVTAEGRPAGTVVADAFTADQFARPFDALLCREVLEHVPDPRALLAELHAATAPGGVCQVTTPRPIDDGARVEVYQPAHLRAYAPDRLVAELTAAGFDVIESDVWEMGQRHVCRRPVALDPPTDPGPAPVTS